ncbi:MAG: NifU family protein [Zavarzinella sp.]
MTQQQLLTQVEKALKEVIAPEMDLDGALLDVVGIDDGCVQVRLNGICSSCPATMMSMLAAMEQHLKTMVPEVDYLEAVI